MRALFHPLLAFLPQTCRSRMFSHAFISQFRSKKRPLKFLYLIGPTLSFNAPLLSVPFSLCNFVRFNVFSALLA